MGDTSRIPYDREGPMTGIVAWHIVLTAVMLLALVVIFGVIYVARRGIPRGIARRVASRDRTKPRA